MDLPVALEDIILDYYWSHRMYRQKQKIHQELLLSSFFRFVLQVLE